MCRVSARRSAPRRASAPGHEPKRGREQEARLGDTGLAGLARHWGLYSEVEWEIMKKYLQGRGMTQLSC